MFPERAGRHPASSSVGPLDIDRDRFMTPAEAVRYGLIDELVERKALAAQSQRRPIPKRTVCVSPRGNERHHGRTTPRRRRPVPPAARGRPRRSPRRGRSRSRGRRLRA
ncbi:MAG: ATP-dependent Clp protease proteolytic subunit [Actinobacteria bacterium]|nr:ATP-dependent Clp protease proteolytic subunit [Actinomycetota bacterium]